MQKLILCSLWMVCISLSVFSQNKTIQGKITDQESQFIFSPVHITANNIFKGTTNEICHFSIATEEFLFKLTFSSQRSNLFKLKTSFSTKLSYTYFF